MGTDNNKKYLGTVLRGLLTGGNEYRTDNKTAVADEGYKRRKHD